MTDQEYIFAGQREPRLVEQVRQENITYFRHIEDILNGNITSDAMRFITDRLWQFGDMRQRYEALNNRVFLMKKQYDLHRKIRHAENYLEHVGFDFASFKSRQPLKPRKPQNVVFKAVKDVKSSRTSGLPKKKPPKERSHFSEARARCR